MRHAIAGNRLNRKTSHRKATIRDLVIATLLRERICTTYAKAKEARKVVDQMITLGKKGTLAHKRAAFALLCDHTLVSRLFSLIAPRFAKRAGGYTRIIRYKTRRGDNAELVFLELTEKEKVIVTKKKASAAKKEAEHAAVAPAEVEQPVKVEEKEAPAKKKAKKAEIKSTQKKSDDKVTSAGKPFGGIRKMFNRKTASGG